MPKLKVKATGVWKSFLLSFILPIIGGLIVYFKNKKRDRELANICLVLSIFHSVIAGFFIGFGIVYILSYLGIAQLETIESYSAFLWIPGILLLTILLMKVFEENQYKYFVPVWYLGVFGAIYAYYFAYKKNKPLQKDVLWFFLLGMIIPFVVMIISGLFAFWTTTFVREELMEFESTRKCEGLDFSIYSCVYNQNEKLITIIIENNGTVDITSFKVLINGKEVNLEGILSYTLKAYTIANVSPFEKIIISPVDCPEIAKSVECISY